MNNCSKWSSNRRARFSFCIYLIWTSVGLVLSSKSSLHFGERMGYRLFVQFCQFQSAVSKSSKPLFCLFHQKPSVALSLHFCVVVIVFLHQPSDGSSTALVLISKNFIRDLRIFIFFLCCFRLITIHRLFFADCLFRKC